MPAPVEVPAQVHDVEGLRLVVVEDEELRRVWNTLLAVEHPHGTTTFVGCQVRYLIGSAHGWLGAAGLSASALHLRARDAWMGWSDAQRKTHLHRVVCLSRFLIRPAVRCRHLASHVLGRVLRRLEADFQIRYHYRPWLVETFVEPEHEGVSFKAANFVCVGHSTGRGRYDRDHARARTVKSVYMYELEAHWRRHLGVARVEAAPSLAPGEGLDSARRAAGGEGESAAGEDGAKDNKMRRWLEGLRDVAEAASQVVVLVGWCRLCDGVGVGAGCGMLFQERFGAAVASGRRRGTRAAGPARDRWRCRTGCSIVLPCSLERRVRLWISWQSSWWCRERALGVSAQRFGQLAQVCSHLVGCPSVFLALRPEH